MPFQPTHCSRWDYGYALLKEAGIYDSAGKPVKQREVIIFLLSVFFISSELVLLSLGRYETWLFSLVWPASTWKLVRSTRSRWSWLQRRCFCLFLFCITRRWELAADISEFPICRTTPLVRCQSSSGSNSRRTTLLLTPEPKGLSRFGKLMDHWSTDWRGNC